MSSLMTFPVASPELFSGSVGLRVSPEEDFSFSIFSFHLMDGVQPQLPKTCRHTAGHSSCGCSSKAFPMAHRMKKHCSMTEETWGSWTGRFFKDENRRSRNSPATCSEPPEARRSVKAALVLTRIPAGAVDASRLCPFPEISLENLNTTSVYASILFQPIVQSSKTLKHPRPPCSKQEEAHTFILNTLH